MILIPFFGDFRLLLQSTHRPVFVLSHTPFVMAIAGLPNLAPALCTTSGRSQETSTCNVHKEWPHAPSSDEQILGSVWTPRRTWKAVSIFLCQISCLVYSSLINTAEIGGGCVVSSSLTHQADGVDCTAIQGVSDASCFRGQCIVHQCLPGYEPNALEDSCIEAPVNVLFTAHESFWEAGQSTHSSKDIFLISLFELLFNEPSCLKPSLCHCWGFLKLKPLLCVSYYVTLRPRETLQDLVRLEFRWPQRKRTFRCAST